MRDDDPATTVDRPRLRRTLPKYLSEDEVNSLLAVAEKVEGAKGLRISAMLEILYATGLRVSELVTLPLAALSRDGNVIVVKGKGGKERTNFNYHPH